jgi:hypothetical protein
MADKKEVRKVQVWNFSFQFKGTLEEAEKLLDILDGSTSIGLPVFVKETDAENIVFEVITATQEK